MNQKFSHHSLSATPDGRITTFTVAIDHYQLIGKNKECEQSLFTEEITFNCSSQGKWSTSLRITRHDLAPTIEKSFDQLNNTLSLDAELHRTLEKKYPIAHRNPLDHKDPFRYTNEGLIKLLQNAKTPAPTNPQTEPREKHPSNDLDTPCRLFHLTPEGAPIHHKKSTLRDCLFKIRHQHQTGDPTSYSIQLLEPS